MAAQQRARGTAAGEGMPRPRADSQSQVQNPAEGINPDLEQNVIDQTEDVFMNYMYQSWRQDSDKEQFDATPSVPQFTNLTADPLSPASQVGRQLAKIGDDVNKKYHKEFDDMIDGLNINKSTAYEAFSGVAKKLMEGTLNWGRILTLLSFGYRIAIRVLGFGEGLLDFANVLKNIVSNVVRFISDKTQGIVEWIAAQGGWVSALQYVPSISWQLWTGICTSALLTVGIVWYMRSRS